MIEWIPEIDLRSRDTHQKTAEKNEQRKITMSIPKKPIGLGRYGSSTCLAIALLAFHLPISAEAADSTVPTVASAPADTSAPAGASAAPKLEFFADTINIGSRHDVCVNYSVGSDGFPRVLIEGIQDLGARYQAQVRAETIAKRLNDLYLQNPAAFKALYKDDQSGYPVVSAPGLVPLVTLDKAMIKKFAKISGASPDQAITWLISKIQKALSGKSRDFVPLSEMKEKNPADLLEVADGYRQNGDQALKAGRWQEAQQRYCQALELNADNIETYLRLSVAYLKDGQKDKALQALQSAKSKNPDQDQQEAINDLTAQTK